MILILMACQNKKEKGNNEIICNEDTPVVSMDSSDIKSEKAFRDSLYTCECNQFISKLEEIPDRDSNAYRITINSKAGDWKKSKIINTRPQMSRISYCSEFYTVVSFACGGPCHSEVFIFTTEDRPDEQYDFTIQVKNNPDLIAHYRNEEFDKLLIHNFKNNKELSVDVSDESFHSYEIDSLTMNKNIITLHYTSENEKQKTKTINIKSIL